MSGHSKWHKLKHVKGIADAKRGAIFTKHAKLIALAAKKGGDPVMNPTLKTAIENAKNDNLPHANIEKAIKRGTGELKDAAEILELFYEGYGQAGTALYIHALTDNKNRTVSNLKTILSKNGGRMGEAGCVAWMFEQKGFISIKSSPQMREQIELIAIDAGAEDIKDNGEAVEVYTHPSDFMTIKKKLSDQFEVTSSEITYIPKVTVKIEKEEEARKISNLMSALEEDEDVTNVYSNFDISDEMMEKMGQEI